MPTISYLPARVPFSNGFTASPAGGEEAQPQRGGAQHRGAADEEVGARLAGDSVVVTLLGGLRDVAIARGERVQPRPQRQPAGHRGGRGHADEGPAAPHERGRWRRRRGGLDEGRRRGGGWRRR